MLLPYLLELLLFPLVFLPLLMVAKNLRDFTTARPLSPRPRTGVSVLIPARNEEAGIAAAVDSVLASDFGPFEVIVLDDHSTDRTAAIVREIALRDGRVRLEQAPSLPADWNGKQHACWQLSQLAAHPLLLFMDADVRLKPTAIAGMVSELERRSVSLLSGFPNQELRTPSEELLIPMMYVMLLSYLPLDQMRKSNDPRFGAGCGQLFLARRNEYFACDGHKGIYRSRHDGLQLPRHFRRAGYATDLIDAHDLATVRMYRGLGEVQRGLLKNATEGMAHMPLIIIFSVLLLGGFTLPALTLGHALFWGWSPGAILLLAIATILSLLPRAMIARRLNHSAMGVLLNPLAVLWFVALQWYAYVHSRLGLRPVAWRGRQ